jgi:hypothetical protein
MRDCLWDTHGALTINARDECAEASIEAGSSCKHGFQAAPDEQSGA